MTKLEELIYSLATVIIRYHDTQRGIHPLIVEIDPLLLRKKSRELAMSIMQNRDTKFDEYLKSLIENCTKGYPGRLHFLIFLLHEISFLKAQLDRKTPFNPIEFEEYEKQVAQLFKDLSQLLSTIKSKTCKVSYSALSDTNTSIALSGLLNDAFFGNTFCNSGLLLIDEVFDRFYISQSRSDQEIKALVVSLCMENQNALLANSLQSQNPAQEIQKLESKPITLEIETQTEPEAPTHKTPNLDMEIEKYKVQIQEQEEVNLAQQKAIEELKNKLKEIRIELENVQLELEQKQKELERTQVQRPPFIPSSNLYGLGALSIFNRQRIFSSTPGPFLHSQVTPSRLEVEESNLSSQTLEDIGLT